MSIEAISAARKIQGIAPRDKFVLIGLADYANDEGWAMLRQKALAEWTGYGINTVAAALTSLEDAGLITSKTQYRDDGGKSHKRYCLAFLEGRNNG